MAGLSIPVTIRDEDLRRKLASLPPALRREAPQAIGLALVRGTQQRFQMEEDPDGRRWAPLNPAYAEGKKGAGILRASGMLMRSITYSASPDEVRVGTNRIYARIHQLGGTIVPVKARSLRFRMGGRWIFAKKVVIPARPFLGISTQDERAIGDVVEALMAL